MRGRKFLLCVVLKTILLNLTAFAQITSFERKFESIHMKTTDSSGVLNGYYIIYDLDTLNKRVQWEYKSGKIEGTKIYYFENSNKISSQIDYINNEFNGVDISYNKKGEILRKGYYFNNLKDSTWHYYKDNILIKTENYQNGKLDGDYSEYYDNGNIKIESHYKEDIRIGIYKHYFENGNIMVTGAFMLDTSFGGRGEHSNLSGMWKYYHENGGTKAFGKFSPKQIHKIDSVEVQMSDGTYELRIYYLHFFVKDGIWYNFTENGASISPSFYSESSVYESDFLKAGDF